MLRDVHRFTNEYVGDAHIMLLSTKKLAFETEWEDGN